MRKLFQRNKLPPLSPQWRLCLYLLLGDLLWAAVTWKLTDELELPMSRMAFWPRVALWVGFGALVFYSVMRCRSPDKTALKRDWWRTN